MKIVKILLKIFVVCALLVAIVIAGIALYVEFLGKKVLEKALSNMLGPEVKFESVSINLDKYMVNFRGFSILSEISFDENIFNAEKFTLILNKEKFKKEKRIVFDEMFVKRAVLNIERNKKGIFNVSRTSPGKMRDRGGVAYADEPAASGGLYNFVKTPKKLTIEDSVINFKDYYISQRPFTITFGSFDLILKSGQESGPPSGYIPAECTLRFRILGSQYGEGRFSLRASMAVYASRTDMEMTVETERIDAVQFLPYFEKYTPFSFNRGLFSSSTNFRMHNNEIDSLTTMVFHRLNLVIDPKTKNSRFLGTSVNKLIPYLTSGQGEIIFDFVIKGHANNPQVGLGPRVKFTMGMVVVEELGGLIQQLQRLQK